MDFEKKLAELEKIAEGLESKDISVEDGIKLFEKSIELARDCAAYLSEAKGKVTQIKKELDDILTEPLE